MVAIVSLLLVLTLSFLITRLATVALRLTGVSQDLARLQSISAFSGVGFTTRESEQIVGHPVRRRILIILMIIGNAGIITAISSLILSFADLDSAQEGMQRIVLLGLGVALLWAVMFSKRLEILLDRVMQWGLDRYTHLEVRDYASLLGLTDEYNVHEWMVEAGDWVVDRSLNDLDLFAEGITILGIHRRDGDYIGVPRGETTIHEGDRLVLYGREEDIDELSQRQKGTSGDESHRQKIGKQRQEREQQRKKEQRRNTETQ